MLAGLVVACLALVAAWLCVPGMPKLFNWDHVAKSESTQGAPSASSSGRNAAPRPVEQPTQPSAVVIKGPTLIALEPNPKQKGPGRVSKLSILHPEHDNDPVGPTSKVSIEFHNIPPSQYLWLIVETAKAGFWPIGKCVSENPSEIGSSLIERKGKTPYWETGSPGQELHFGGLNDPESKQKHYTIHLVVVEGEENGRLIEEARKQCPPYEGLGTFVPTNAITEAKRVVFRTQ
jgi:hypothetical protein